jgi:hypothetical protein
LRTEAVSRGIFISLFTLERRSLPFSVGLYVFMETPL